MYTHLETYLFWGPYIAHFCLLENPTSIKAPLAQERSKSPPPRESQVTADLKCEFSESFPLHAEYPFQPQQIRSITDFPRILRGDAKEGHIT